MGKNKDKAAAAEVDTKGKKGKADKGDSKEKAEKTETPAFKFGVDDIAEKLDLKAASVRVKLRNAGIEKAGKSYGWNTKAELDEVVGQLKSAEKTEKAADEKPAKGKSKKDAEPAADEGKSKKDKKKGK